MPCELAPPIPANPPASPPPLTIIIPPPPPGRIPPPPPEKLTISPKENPCRLVLLAIAITDICSSSFNRFILP